MVGFWCLCVSSGANSLGWPIDDLEKMIEFSLFPDATDKAILNAMRSAEFRVNGRMAGRGHSRRTILRACSSRQPRRPGSSGIACSGGEYFAFAAECPHAGGSLRRGEMRGTVLTLSAPWMALRPQAAGMRDPRLPRAANISDARSEQRTVLFVYPSVERIHLEMLMPAPMLEVRQVTLAYGDLVAVQRLFPERQTG